MRYKKFCVLNEPLPYKQIMVLLFNRIFFIYYDLGHKTVVKFTKLSKIGFPMEFLIAPFLPFSDANVKICPLVSRLGTGHQIPAFHGVENSSFPKILSLKSFGNLRGNSCIHFLLTIVYFFFTCRVEKLDKSVKKSTNYFFKIAIHWIQTYI